MASIRCPTIRRDMEVPPSSSHLDTAKETTEQILQLSEDPYIEFETTYEAVEVKIGHRRSQLKARDRWS